MGGTIGGERNTPPIRPQKGGGLVRTQVKKGKTHGQKEGILGL